jgi:heparosan-N-sulfate-glucuronate 5-epimerase
MNRSGDGSSLRGAESSSSVRPPPPPLQKVALEAVEIRPGHTSLAPDLGGYYLDLSAVPSFVESGYHGPLDELGVPMTEVGDSQVVYNPTTIAQYALGLHDKIITSDGPSGVLEGKLRAQLAVLVERIEHRGKWAGFFVHHWRNAKYGQLIAPWVSSLAQGNGLSALLRAYQLLGDPHLLKVAASAFRALERPLGSGGVRAVDRCGHLWFEEYPLEPPIHVLNGFIFTLWGILDYARVSDDQRAWDWWKSGVETLKAHVADFDSGYWSRYDLGHRELASRYYHSQIHIPQLEVMAALTGDAVFDHYATRWRRFSKSSWCGAMWWLALRVEARTRHRPFH